MAKEDKSAGIVVFATTTSLLVTTGVGCLIAGEFSLHTIIGSCTLLYAALWIGIVAAVANAD